MAPSSETSSNMSDKLKQMSYPVPDDEDERINKLHSYQILDSLTEEAYDNLTKIAAEIFDTPIALVSLVDTDRQWFKAKVGLDVDQTPREQAFCAHNIMDKELLIVEDAKQDPRFKDNPLVIGDPNIRFYAGAPIITPDDFLLGSLCVIDRKPRKITKKEEFILSTLSDQVTKLLEIKELNSELIESQLESEEKFRSIFDNSPLGIIILDTSGIISDLNPRISEMLGYKKAGLIGKSILEITPEVDKEKSRLILKNLLEGDLNVFTYEKRYITKNGNHKDVELTVFKIIIENEEFIIDIVNDITEEKRLENEMRRKDAEMEQSRRIEAVGLLAGGIAHDFNNTLTLISGYTELSKMYINNPTILSDYLDEIAKGAKSATNLVNSLLVFSKNRDKELEIYNIVSFFQEFIPTISRTIGSNIEISVDYYSDEILIFGRKDDCTQVFMNLLTNARDAIENTGLIEINIEMLDSSEYPITEILDFDQNYCIIEVRDSGIGIPEDQLDKIFDPFHSTKSEGKGTGLGLTNVKRIVEEHDGLIQVDSEIGVGTTFTIILPEVSDFGKDNNEADVVQIEQDLTLEGKQVLLVEDNKKVQHLIASHLKSLDADVITADNGQEGLDHLLAMDIDLLITDVQMPKITGVQLADIARSYHPDLPILIMSANLDNGKYGIDSIDEIPFIKKPFTLQELNYQIHRCLGLKLEDNY